MNVEERAMFITELIPAWTFATMGQRICIIPPTAPTTLKEAGRESIPAKLSLDSTSSKRLQSAGMINKHPGHTEAPRQVSGQ